MEEKSVAQISPKALLRVGVGLALIGLPIAWTTEPFLGGLVGGVGVTLFSFGINGWNFIKK